MITRQKTIVETDDARQAMLLDLIEKYLPLDQAEQQEFERLLGQPEAAEAKQMVTFYERRGMEQGLEQGLVRGKRETLLRQLRRRFGDLPPEAVARVEAIADEAELDACLDQILTAATLEEMDLP